MVDGRSRVSKGSQVAVRGACKEGRGISGQDISGQGISGRGISGQGRSGRQVEAGEGYKWEEGINERGNVGWWYKRREGIGGEEDLGRSYRRRKGEVAAVDREWYCKVCE